MNNTTYGSFETKIIIDNDAFEVIFHVVDDLMMKHAVLVGVDFLNLVELHAIKGQVTIRKIVHEVPEVFKIDTVEVVNSNEISYISEKDARREIKEIAKNYEPVET